MVRTSRSRLVRSRAHGFSALSTSLGVALTLLVFGGLVALALVVKDLRAEWMSSLALEVVLSSADVEEGAMLSAQWADFEEVRSVRYVAPDSAAAELERELGEPFMEFLGSSPLPAVMEIRMEPDWMASAGLAGLADQVAIWEARPEVVRVDYPRRVLTRLDRGFSDWTWPAAGAALLLAFVVVAQIFNVVRLSVFGRRQLIRSMDLVGASPAKVRRPFVFEAMGYGGIGALLAYAGLVSILASLQPYLDVLGQWGMPELLPLLALQLAMGLLITGLSARLAVSQYLGASLDRLM